jgi:hypothetical protein
MTKLHKYPDPDEIQINEAALRLKFHEFKNALKSNPCLLDLFVILPAWIPVFFSTFNDFHGLSGTGIKYAYATLIALASLAWLGQYRHIVHRLYKKLILKDFSGAIQDIDPDKKVDSIKQDCNRGDAVPPHAVKPKSR